MSGIQLCKFGIEIINNKKYTHCLQFFKIRNYNDPFQIVSTKIYDSICYTFIFLK